MVHLVSGGGLEDGEEIGCEAGPERVGAEGARGDGDECGGGAEPEEGPLAAHANVAGSITAMPIAWKPLST